jgi:alpha-galactosidase
MLPIGYLGPAPGWGKARETRMTHDEQRTLLTLWTIFRSPLMIGANLPKNDAWTTSLLTNPEVIAVDQHSHENRPVISTSTEVVWTARPDAGDDRYLAVFNLDEHEQKLHYDWKDLELTGPKFQLRDLWERKNLGTATSLSVTLAPHACALYRLLQ